ncbi:unnamed protein product [Didymodactylos carnosus]|uniref:RRM domain-containing protein n=1 Tax=Didymodactylos carnosus TaxID=1234261 RepID=A0A814KWB7_9BILA|nr:unnamed protein product [Didymodactylos carnosus]CAF1136336.1 unnamed protein product [Didymodactylos carnosus]CAF3826540.1 unnamed protein product [Didymodactylos carnosus]CAF3925688.1 unnamed protein product [Didymodactylos carnosus]
METGQPNNTIYVNNLNERVKLNELKKYLFAIFSKFGTILDIVALKNLRMRGQAFIIFDDVESAKKALTSMQSFPFYEKPLRIQFAKSDSDIVSKRKGTYQERPKRRTDNDQPSISKKEKRRQQLALKQEQQRLLKQQMGQYAAMPPMAGMLPAGLPPGMPLFPPPPMMRSVLHPPIFGGEMPNNILFLSNLPNETPESMLTMLFKAYNGFREVRLITGRDGIAFVEFDTEHQASLAKDALQGFKIGPDKPMQITFAKK